MVAYTPSKNSTFWPAAMVTMAFFQLDRLPTKRPMRFSLPRTTAVRTATTSTFHSFSTAWRISTLLASRGDLEQQLRLQRLGIQLALAVAARLLEAGPLLGEQRALDDLFG